MSKQVKFEIRRLSGGYRIVKVFPPQKMFEVVSIKPIKTKPIADESPEEIVLEFPISNDSIQYCNIITDALNKYYKEKTQ